jgi:Tol biopolymer transport system component
VTARTYQMNFAARIITPIMSLAPATRLGPYEILAPLGAGGMGEVYRARDTRLERTVAIKILPGHLSADPLRKQRFEREAKTISGLNHPHICVLYDVGQQDGIDFLVMECVEGETLAKRLEKGPLPVEQVLKYGAQIADALDRAHRSGIVHRDLKPGNIMLTAAGAKLLDFGLARPAAPLSDATTLAVVSKSPVTEEGTILGTFPYMSPEQVEGKELDGRSDIFSLGAVLYEMLTGQRAFQGKSQLSVASAILEREPAPVNSIKPLTLPALDHAIKKCLAKSGEERWQSASDLASELKWIGESGTQAVVPSVRTVGVKRVATWVLVSVLVGAAIGAFLWRSPAPEQTLYFSANLPFPAHDVAVAPNGHTVAVVGYLESMRDTLGTRNVIWIYEVGSQEGRNLSGTEGANFPFWSPDGKWLGFFADGKLKKVDIAGGHVQVLCDAPSGRGGSWNNENVIIFTPEGVGSGIFRISASGGTPTKVTAPDSSRGEYNHRWPVFLPDGTHFLYLAFNFSGQKGVNDLFVGSLDTNQKQLVSEMNANVLYTASGYLLFPREKTLFAQRFDVKRFVLTGEPSAVLNDIQFQPQIRRAVFAAADGRALVVQSGNGEAISQPQWFDRHGTKLGEVGKPDVYQNVFLAPNRQVVAVDKTDMASLNTEVWTYELERDSAKRLTFDPAIDGVPIWSPDSTKLVFNSTRKVVNNLFIKNSDGTGEEKCLVCDERAKWPNDWSRDGKYVLYTRGTDLCFVAFPDLKPKLYLKAIASIKNGQFSPDGKWVAYASNETGKWQVYVTSFPDAQGKWQVSSEGGEQPRWRGDGKELFYLSLESKLMAAPVTIGSKFDSGPPIALFRATPRQANSLLDQFVYDVTRDGHRFLVNTQVKNAETEPMTVVLNWDAELKKK